MKTKYRIVRLTNGKFAIQTKGPDSFGIWWTDRGGEWGSFGYFDSEKDAEEKILRHIKLNSTSVVRYVKEISE